MNNQKKAYRTIYLERIITDNGTLALREISAGEWKAIMEANKQLAPEQKRQFIKEEIEESTYIDQMMIEVSYPEYLKWDRARKEKERNLTPPEGTVFFSIDEQIDSSDNEDGDTEADRIAGYDSPEDEIIDEMLLDEIREELDNWRPWARRMFDLYLDGRKKEISEIIMCEYGVTEQTVIKYKRQIKEFLKNLIQVFHF